MISAGLIEEACQRIRPYIHHTRVFSCAQLSSRAQAAGPGAVQREVFLKAEHEQRTGSFKMRGAMNAACLSSAKHLVTDSSGNHAQAVALAAQLLGKHATVVMPMTSPSVKVNAVRDSYGAEVRMCDPTQEAREALSAEILQELRSRYGQESAEEVPSSQDARVINGQGSIAVELLQQQPELDAVVVSVGGGGLIAGIATYMKAMKPSVKIIGAEPERACSAYMSKMQGRLVKSPVDVPIETIADCVKVSLGHITYPIIMDKVDAVFVASEAEIEDSTRFVMERTKQVIEPGCGVAVAVATSKALYETFPYLRHVGVVLCGGNVDLLNLPWMRRAAPASLDGTAWSDYEFSTPSREASLTY